MAAADGIGFPLLVKASYGGGGRGMRTVTDELGAARGRRSRRGVRRLSAFGDGAVFLERLITPARHVEVQIFGDTHGTVVALHERECSIQRRHQKVVEEAPSPAVDAAAARPAGRSGDPGRARRSATSGAGTVEFLLAPDGEFYFLEVNTRLQVEHPVTEAVTGLDLVDLQFAVAAGAAAARRRHANPSFAVRRSRYGSTPRIRRGTGCRRPGGWMRSPSTIRATFGGVGLTAAGGEVRGVRLDSGVETASTIGVSYDPMLAKVIAWAPDRARSQRAARRRRCGEREISGVVTNRDLLVRVLESDGLARR